MINEGRIQCFLTLAQTLNFTETADRLYMTQQGVSKHIAQIEEKLGFPLFVRSGRSVSLTNAGKECYALFSDFMEQYERLQRKHRDLYRMEQDFIRIGYQDWLDLGMAVPRAWNEVRRRGTSLHVMGERYSPDYLNERFAAGELDMIVLQERFAKLNRADHSLVLTTTPLQLLVSPNNPLTKGDSNASTFYGEPLLVDAFDSESIQETKERVARENQLCHLQPKEIIVMPNRDSSYVAAELGHGVIVATAMSQNTTLRRYPLGVDERLLCIWREGANQDHLEYFAWMLKREYQKESGG